MTEAPQVLLLGDINVDVTLDLDGYPEQGDEALAKRTLTHPGGGVANTACVLAKMGLAPRLFARVGRDPFGDFALDEYTRAGIDLCGVSRDPTASTGLTLIAIVPGGERTMFSSRGANCSLSPEDIPADCVYGAQLLQLTGYAFLETPQREAAWKIAGLAREKGIPISLDTAIAPVVKARAHILKLLEILDTCILGMKEAGALFGTQTPQESARALLARGISTAAIKLGSQGSCLVRQGEGVLIPAFPVQSIDATGAGDAFSAGLLFGRAAGLSLPASGVLASALGALATTVHGAGPALPGGKELVGFLGELVDGGRYPELTAALTEAREKLVVILSAQNAVPNGQVDAE